jgi:predicted NUDIX family phosphoesterase
MSKQDEIIVAHRAEHINKLHDAVFRIGVNGLYFVANQIAWDVMLYVLGLLSINVNRQEAETNSELRHLIPYVVLISDDRVLSYKRTTKAGEARLHDFYSIGFGGHINTEDVQANTGTDINLDATIKNTIKRELKEELGFNAKTYNLRLKGILKLDDSPVNSVHYGLVYFIYLNNIEETQINCTDIGLDNLEWKEVDELLELNLEPWSKAIVTTRFA